ncbi:MAG: hypothetical protein R6U63_02335 [Longimicrobiales bacterium]
MPHCGPIRWNEWFDLASRPNAHADVEALHRIMEEHPFDPEVYRDLDDFLRKTAVYQHFFD